MTTDPAETPTIKTLADGFHVRLAVDNTAWIDLGPCVIVVDALEEPELEADIFDAIAETLGDKPIRYMLNTHTHYDHVALNAAFERRFGTEIINAQTTDIPAEGRWFEGPKHRVQMLPMPGCHTQEDCIVWVPEDRVLFTGDIFGWGLIPLTRPLRDESAKLLVDTYRRLIDLDPAVIVPGHGPTCTPTELTRWIEYFAWLQTETRRACQAGQDDEQILAELAPPQDMQWWWRFVEWKHADSAKTVLRAVRTGRLSD